MDPAHDRPLKLVCFSPTGTSRAVLRAVGRGLGADDVELVDITLPERRRRRLTTATDELLVVAVPVYSGRVPELACRWLESLEANATPAVGIVVYGNREFEDALLELTDILRERGAMPVAGAAFIGEHSFSSTATPIAAARPDADDLQRAEQLGREVREKLRATAAGGPGQGLSVPGSRPYRERQTRPPGMCIAVGDACVQCGTCADACPVGAIDLHDSAEVDDDACIVCCACLKSCPQGVRSLHPPWLKEIAVHLSERCSARKEPECFV